MKNKRITLLFALLVLSLPVAAVLNNQNLDHVVQGIKNELWEDWNLRNSKQEELQQKYAEQHAKMLDLIKDCDRLSMSLYLQKKDFTFDLSHTLERVSQEYSTFAENRTPYDLIVRELDTDIDRYARFMEALRRLPPVLETLDVVPDSLSYHNDSLDTYITQSGISLEKEVVAEAMADSLSSPFVLTEQGQADRDSCLLYAGELLKIYAENRALVLADSLHYQAVFLRLKESYDYANTRYKELQRQVFVEGQTPWWEILANRSHYRKIVAQDIQAQYSTVGISNIDLDKETSDTKSMNTFMFMMVALLLFALFFVWLIASFLLWLFCLIIKPMGRNLPKEKRPLFALVMAALMYLLMVRPSLIHNPGILETFRQITTFLWLLMAIVTALLIRLKPERIRNAFRLYIPTIFMALTVIVCRGSSFPNTLMNYVFPPVLIGLLLWQLLSCLTRGRKAEKSDRVICWISFTITVIAAILAVFGYIFVALMVLVWWYFQLAAILTLVTLSHLIHRYQQKYMEKRLQKAAAGITLVNGADKDSLLFGATWFNDLVCGVLFPCLGLISIPMCVHYSLGVFDFDDLFQRFYYNPFVQIAGKDGDLSFRMSIQSIVWIMGLFFLFRYVNKALHAFWQRGRYNAFLRKYNRTTIRANEINLSLGNSLISVGIWFLYIVVVVQLLHIPTGSLTLVAGGLSAGIGLAMKDIINNFIYGIQLMSGRLRVGDWIECEGVRGQVIDINYQSTQVQTEEATTVSFLNSTLFGKSFTNLTKGHSYELLKIVVGVAYGTDVQKVRDVLEKALEVMKTKDKYGRDVVDPHYGIYIRFNEFGESAVEIAVKQYVLAAEHIAYREKAREVIYNALNENGITIPFPQRDVHMKE